MLVRRGRALREIPADDSNDHGVAASAMEIPDASPDPETSYLRRERVQILSETLGNLRPGLRLAISLRELAELSTDETARRMGISVARRKSTVFSCQEEVTGKIRPLYEVQSDDMGKTLQVWRMPPGTIRNIAFAMRLAGEENRMLKINFSETPSEARWTLERRLTAP